MTTDQTPDSDQQRYTITEAAKRLGISREALRLRIRRGRVLASKSGGQWYVYLPVDTPVSEADTAPDTSTVTDQGAIVANLRDELDYARAEITRLWSALEVRDRELERKDAIILALAQRPALPAPAPSDRSTVEGPPAEGVGETVAHRLEHLLTDAAATARPRPWWRRWLRG